VVAPSPLVYVLLAARAGLGRLLDGFLRCLLVLLPLAVALVVLIARLATMPGYVVMDTLPVPAGLALGLGTVVATEDLAGLALGAQAPPEVGHVLQSCACC